MADGPCPYLGHFAERLSKRAGPLSEISLTLVMWRPDLTEIPNITILFGLSLPRWSVRCCEFEPRLRRSLSRVRIL